MTKIDWKKFDHLLMDSTSAPSIKHGLQPAGFSYAAYEAGTGTTPFGIENAWGIRDPSHHPLTNGSVHECDSMSKTLTALSMMYQISLVPDVSDAYKAYQAANGQQKDAKRQTWQDRVEHYLDQKIANYVLRSSGDSTDWSALPAVSTIRIKDLMMHTSGLSVHDVHGSPQVVGGGDDWSSIQKDLVAWSDAHYQSAQTHVPVFYSNTNFALLRYVIGLFNLITVCGVSPHEAHGEFHGTWIER